VGYHSERRNKHLAEEASSQISTMDVLADALKNANLEDLHTSMLEEVVADEEVAQLMRRLSQLWTIPPTTPIYRKRCKLGGLPPLPIVRCISVEEVTLAVVTRSTTQAAGYLMTLDTAHKVAQQNEFGKRHKIWGTEYPPA
jgi:hypothetical protein